MPKIDVTKFIEQSGIRKTRFGGYETQDVRQAMQALCIEYEQRLKRAENHAKALGQQYSALEQHCQTLTAQNRRLSEQSAALAGNSEASSRRRNELEDRVASLKEKNHSLGDQCAVLQLKNSDLKKENDALKEQAAQAQAELRIKGRDLDNDRAALRAERQQRLDEADEQARQIVEHARRKADRITAEADEKARAVLTTAKEQAHAQARRLVESAATEANEVQNANQLRLNSIREEVRTLEQRREKLIDFLNRMARELMQVEGTAKDEEAPELIPEPIEHGDPFEVPHLQEVPTPPVELDLGPEAIARAVDELRAQAAAEEQEAAEAQVQSPAASAAPPQQPAPQPKPAPADHDPTRQTGPALTEVPGAIFSSPIVRQEENLPDEEPPAAVPRRPVMPQLADDEEPAAAEPRPGRDRVLRALRGLHRRLARTGAAAR